MDVSGKKVLITGANRGLGYALALACAQAGASEIVAGARQPETLARLQEAAAVYPVQITPVQLDVTQEQQTQTAAAQIGRVDILVNNAGVAAFGGVLKGAMADLQREVEVNYFGVLRVVRAFAPAMADHGDGLIVNIGSQLGKVNIPALGTYCALKAALLSLSQAMRGDLADRGVRVITVLPGTMDTDMTQGFQGAKMSTQQAAFEILAAMQHEQPETPIGKEARQILATLVARPGAVEKVFAQFRA